MPWAHLVDDQQRLWRLGDTSPSLHITAATVIESLINLRCWPLCLHRVAVVACSDGCVARVGQAYAANNCSRIPSLEISTVPVCYRHVTAVPLHVDPRIFEAALVNAVQHAGHRLRFRNMRPRPDNTTETGWTRR